MKKISNFKYLKKFNENSSGECSFDDFKDLMLDILDNFDFRYNFSDFSSEENGFFYDCLIFIDGPFNNQEEVPYMNLDFIGYDVDNILPTTDSTMEITDKMLDDCIETISDNIDDINHLKSNIDIVIKNHENCISLFKMIKNLPSRFETFSNFKGTEIGYLQSEIRITFEMGD